MRKVVVFFIFCKIALPGFAQEIIWDRVLLVAPDSTYTLTFDDFEQDSVFFHFEQDSVFSLPDTLVLISQTPQESFLTQWLRFFSRGFDASELIEQDFEYAPIFEGADSVFQERLKNINTLMDLPYNARVRSYIEVYISRRRTQTKVMLELSKYYFPIFERELEKHGLPEELKYLPIIESALNPRAMSHAGAAGLWQFMYRTGRMYGLKADRELDERLDPEKATEAAALYLKSLYNTYKDWTLAIAAYNCGPGNVNRAIRRARNKRDYWEIYNYLPRETRNYVPAFIGATYAMTYYREHGITVSETSFPEIGDTLMINQRVRFDRIAQFTGVPIQTIRDHNPQYKMDFIPESQEPFILRLPANYILKFIEYSDSIYEPPISESDSVATEFITAKGVLSKVTYRVKRGDNLSLIGVRFGVTVAQLKEWNNLTSDLLKINQNLTIYTTKTNLRDMTEVVAIQNAERAKAAELAATNQAASQPAPSPQRQLQQTQPSRTTTAQNRPATTTSTTPKPATQQQNTASSSTTNTQTSAPSTTTQSQAKPSNNQAVKPNVVPAATSRTTPTHPTPLANQTTSPSQAIPLKSTTGNVRSSNVAVVQSKNAKTATDSKFVYYKVQKGETLFSIQRKHQGSSVQEIINLNNLRDNGNKIYPNQVLKIRVN
jgi:membrane-bound lytic murein transglycosylase D